MPVAPIEKSMIGLVGETRVCAELLKKGHLASVTHGNAKATDILILGKTKRFLRVEVKTSVNGRNFVTGYFPKYTDASSLHPDLWVFYLPDKDLSTGGDRFFIASHKQVGEFQLEVNKGRKTLKGQGCDNIPLKLLLEKGIEDKWNLVSQQLEG